MAKWRLDQTEPRNDGSGSVAFDIWGLDDNDNPIPGRHTTVLLDADDIQAALDLPTNQQTNQQMKELIAAQLNDAEWSNEALDQIVLDNENAATVDGNLDIYIDSEIGGYPVTFTL